LVCLLTFSPAALRAQSPSLSGSEFGINGAAPGEQAFPSLFISGHGGLVVWQDNTIDGAIGTGIAARSLDTNLAPVGAAFRVNQKLPGDQLAPAVVQLAGGNSLVVWHTRLVAHQSVVGRLLSSSNTFLSGDIALSPESTTNVIKYKTNWFAFSKNRYRKRSYRLKDVVWNIRELSGQPALAALPDGGAVVAYQSASRHETNSWALSTYWAWNGKRNVTNDLLVPTRVFIDWMHDVYFQRVSASGAKLGPEVQVNQAADFNQRSPALAVLANGNFVVAWVSEQQRVFLRTNNFNLEIRARLFNGQGQALGDEFVVSGTDDLLNANPAVSALASGGFVIAWSQQETLLSRRWDVVSQTFLADGTPSGSRQLVNTYTVGDQFGPKLAAVGDNQLVVWTSLGQDGSREGVYGRLLNGGTASGDEFLVNTTTISRQLQPAVAADAAGRFLVAWASYTGVTGFDLFGQGYSIPTTVTAPVAGATVGQAYLSVELNQPARGATISLPATLLNPLASPAAAAPAPAEVPLQLGLEGPIQKLHLHWNTLAGARYQVERSADFKVWTPVGEARTAAGATDSVGLDLSEAAAFYRVVQLR
jgi:hypothetical protein